VKYRYTKFTGDDLDDLDLEELLSKLSDLLLGSGFDNPYRAAVRRRRRCARAFAAVAARRDPRSDPQRRMLSEETLERLLSKDWRDSEDANRNSTR
jgi:hypothetical protein